MSSLRALSGGQKRPDIDIIMGERRLLVDAAVLNPACSSHITQAVTPLGACKEMVGTKLNKYEAMARDLHAEVVPAVMEVFGALTDDCISLFKSIANYSMVDPYCLWSKERSKEASLWMCQPRSKSGMRGLSTGVSLATNGCILFIVMELPPLVGCRRFHAQPTAYTLL